MQIPWRTLNLWTVPVLSQWAGCRAERPSPHSQDTRAGVLTVQSLPVLCPSLLEFNLLTAGIHKNTRGGEATSAENQRKAVAYILYRSQLLQCLFCKCCIPRLFVRKGSVLSTEVVFYSLNTCPDILALDAIITPLLLLFFLVSHTHSLCVCEYSSFIKS